MGSGEFRSCFRKEIEETEITLGSREYRSCFGSESEGEVRPRPSRPDQVPYDITWQRDSTSEQNRGPIATTALYPSGLLATSDNQSDIVGGNERTSLFLWKRGGGKSDVEDGRFWPGGGGE